MDRGRDMGMKVHQTMSARDMTGKSICPHLTDLGIGNTIMHHGNWREVLGENRTKLDLQVLAGFKHVQVM
jgi:hypothetical protein